MSDQVITVRCGIFFGRRRRPGSCSRWQKMPSICSGATNKETLPATPINEELARRRAGLKRSKQFVPSGKCMRGVCETAVGHPELLGTERKSYEMYKREATASARRVTDPVLRDRSVGHIIDLCVDGGEEDQARALLSVVQSEFVRREIAEKHPQLRLFVAIDQRRRSG